jgi:hypothetical protein
MKLISIMMALLLSVLCIQARTSSGPRPDFNTVPKQLQRAFQAVENMVERANSQHPPVIFVTASRWYVNHRPYVNLSDTVPDSSEVGTLHHFFGSNASLRILPGFFANLRQTQTGFEGDAYVHSYDNMPQPLMTALANDTKLTDSARTNDYKVHVEIRLEDLNNITYRDGETDEAYHTLFDRQHDDARKDSGKPRQYPANR